MPAHDDDAACTVAGVRKPSKNETAGSGRRRCRGRYGDLRAAELRDDEQRLMTQWLTTLPRMIGPPQVLESALRHEDRWRR